MRHIGLTGNVAAGKSAVAALFRRWGATVVDADEIVHQLQQRGTPVLAAITGRFGTAVLRPDGSLDRARLRALVFADEGARRDLEAIVHPAVQARRAELLAEAGDRGDPVVVSDIPLLFETMDPAQFDAVVLVDAPAAVRRERLMAQRGFSAEDADRLIAAQVPATLKRARSSFVIDNDGDEAALERRARKVWEAIAAA
ncbi:MAG: dephospho-CoA kinase [Bacillota bacterium]